MRKVVVFNRMSLDGYFAGENDSINWFVVDPQVDAGSHEMMSPDTILFGRLTFDQFAAVWPAMEDNPHAPEPAKAMARELANMNKVVFSTTADEPTWENSTLHKGNLIEEVQNLKKSDGGDITIFGSGTIIQQLAEAGLIDEYIIGLTPVVLGGGKRLFDGVPGQKVELQDARPFDSGNVLLHYTIS